MKGLAQGLDLNSRDNTLEPLKNTLGLTQVAGS